MRHWTHLKLKLTLLIIFTIIQLIMFIAYQNLGSIWWLSSQTFAHCVFCLCCLFTNYWSSWAELEELVEFTYVFEFLAAMIWGRTLPVLEQRVRAMAYLCALGSHLCHHMHLQTPAKTRLHQVIYRNKTIYSNNSRWQLVQWLSSQVKSASDCWHQGNGSHTPRMTTKALATNRIRMS